MEKTLKKKRLFRSRLLSILLCVSIIFSSVSFSAFAEETQNVVSESSMEDVAEMNGSNDAVEENVTEDVEDDSEDIGDTEDKEDTKDDTKDDTEEENVTEETEDKEDTREENVTEETEGKEDTKDDTEEENVTEETEGKEDTKDDTEEENVTEETEDKENTKDDTKDEEVTENTEEVSAEDKTEEELVGAVEEGAVADAELEPETPVDALTTTAGAGSAAGAGQAAGAGSAAGVGQAVGAGLAADVKKEEEKTVTLENVQALIDRLPDTVTEENLDDVLLLMEEIDDALEMLETDELEQLDYTKYYALVDQLGSTAIINVDLMKKPQSFGNLELTIPVRKTVEGKNGDPKDGTFTFTIINNFLDEIPAPEVNEPEVEIDVNLPKADIDISGPKVSMPSSFYGVETLEITTENYEGEEEFHYTVHTPGEYAFTITEDAHRDLKYERNRQEYIVAVYVEYNEETEELEMTGWTINDEEADEDTAVEFVNVYNNDKNVASLDIPIHKKVTGTDIIDGSFKFWFSAAIDICGPKVDIEAPKVDIEVTEPMPPIDPAPEVSVMSLLLEENEIEGEAPQEIWFPPLTNEHITINTEDGAGTETVELTYDHEGTYKYFVREIMPEGDLSYKYDTKEYNVVVTVTKDENGKLVASYEISYTDWRKEIYYEEPAEEILFENESTPICKVKKTVVGNDKNLDSREFEFEGQCFYAAPWDLRGADVFDPELEWMERNEQNLEFTIQGDGEIYPEMPEIDYGMYKFVIREIDTGVDGYVYDNSERVLYIKHVPQWWCEDLDDKLQFYVDGERVAFGYEFEFTNRYKSTDVTIPVEKKISGDKPESAKDFIFVLNKDGQMVDEITVNGEGSAEFNTLTFDKAGEYTYTVNEITGNEAGYSYDQTVHTVVVTVADLNGELEADWSLDGVTAEADTKVIFTNQYEAPEASENPEPRSEEPKGEDPKDEEPKGEETKNENPSDGGGSSDDGGSSHSGGSTSGGGGSSSGGGGGSSFTGGSTSGGPGVVEQIENNEVPLAEMPEVSEELVETVEIAPTEVPLARLAQTGDNTKDLLWIMLSLLSLSTFAWMYTLKKRNTFN